MRHALVALAALVALQPAFAAGAARIERATLADGLDVLAWPAPRPPLVAIRLVIPGGRAAEKTDGEAELLAAMLSDHTRRHDHAAWSAWLDAHALRFSIGTDAESWTVSVLALREQLPAALDAIAEALLAPGWNEKRFANLKERAIAAAKKAREEPGRLATERLLPALFGRHPYAHIPGGTPESLARIRLADLRRLYRAQFHPEGAHLVVAGDVHLKDLLPLARARLDRWRGAPALALADIPAPAAPKPARIHVPAPTTQTLIVLARLGPSRRDPLLFPDFLVNEAFGGGSFSSLLMKTLREQKGLVYGAYSYFEPRAKPGPWIVRVQTRNEKADEAARTTRRLMRRIARKGLPQALVRATAKRMAGRFPQSLDSNRERADLLAMVAFYGLPLDYLDEWPRRILAVDARDAARAARALDPRGWIEIRVGPERK